MEKLGWKWSSKRLFKKYLKTYDFGNNQEHSCLNCGKTACSLAGVGNQAGRNENNGCWLPITR